MARTQENPSNSSGFKPIDPKATSARAVANRVKSEVQEANPSERRSGGQWYDRSHRDAVRIGSHIDPGKPIEGAQGYKEGVQRPGRQRLRGAELDAFHNMSKGERQQAADRGAGALAVVSPSHAGMTYEKSVPASHAAWDINSSDMRHVNQANATSAVVSKTQGAVAAAKNADKKGLGSPAVMAEVTAAHEHASAVANTAADTARAQPHVAGTMLKHVSSVASIGQAHELLGGEKTAEQVLPMEVKTGAYYQNIRDPKHSRRATIDGRSHDIGVGRTLGWGVNRGLGGKARYGKIEEGHQIAADEMGMMPHQAQAVSWVHNKHKVEDSGLSRDEYDKQYNG